MADDLQNLDKILNRDWLLKRSVTSITSSTQRYQYYDATITNGALDGKLLGVGE